MATAHTHRYSAIQFSITTGSNIRRDQQMGLFNFLKKKEMVVSSKSKDVVPVAEKSLTDKNLAIHEDLRNLVWVGDGKFKNYTQKQDNESSYDIGGIRISISFMNQEEPSLIYTQLRVTQPSEIGGVERPPYFPTYSGLTPEQKWVYLKLLSNPYDTSIDIGFVFILYYGLERHLLSGNFEEAFEVILKLRDVHTNKSFQSYSANALVLTCMLHDRGDLISKFIESLDKDHEFAFSDNLFLICYYSFDLPLLPKDIMRMAKTFEFSNMNYIKKHPDLFLENLKNEISSKLGTEEVFLKKYLTSSELKKVRYKEINIFANMSIREKSIPVPLLSENFKLKKEIYIFLETAHENVKTKLAELRKAGKTIPTKEKAQKPKKKIVFDEKQEKVLLSELAQQSKNLVDRHFMYLNLQNFYYKYRDVNKIYLDKCIEFCLLDINSLPEMQEAYVAEEIERAKQFASGYSSESLARKVSQIKKEGFVGSIPAFKRLAIIYEKLEEFDKAIIICDRAIEYGESIHEFKERKDKIEAKKNSQ
jgi:hypothetical protein